VIHDQVYLVIDEDCNHYKLQRPSYEINPHAFSGNYWCPDCGTIFHNMKLGEYYTANKKLLTENSELKNKLGQDRNELFNYFERAVKTLPR